ncbi:MAG TPA: hypothetical protein DF614_08275, partial [Methylococcaceae bacterium]|nr:hypothetical protein [Methylococcaceae bacterium]
MAYQKTLLSFTITGLLSTTSAAFAFDKPKTMDEMWKIIEMQQKQIEALQKTNAATPTPQTTDNVAPSTSAAQTNDVKKLERKTDVLSQE